MSLKLKKGMSYLVETNNAESKRFWIVQQTGRRSWVATQFTDCITDHDGSYTVIMGNSLKVVKELEKVSSLKGLDWRVVVSNKVLRSQMFDILQKGEFSK